MRWCRYNEIAELVVAAAQRQLMQQRAEREGVVLPASRQAVVKVRTACLAVCFKKDACCPALTT